jgi:hypothetical protein
VNAGGSIQEWENGAQRWRDRPDNQIVVRAALVVPAEPPALGLAWAEDFAKSWRNETFGIGVDFHAGSSLDARGLIGELDAAVPVRLFGQDFALVAAELYAQDAPHDTRLSRFHLGVSVLGQVVYGKDVTDPSFEYTDTPFQAVKSVEHRAIVFAGPVPIELKAGVMGELGFDLTFRMDTASATLEGKPYFAITGYASAGVNLVVASVAVRGDLELLRDELTASMGATLAVTGAGRYLEGRLLLDATNVLTGPNGRIFLEATYPGVKLCKVLGVPVPCGVTTHRKEKTLAKFETFTKTDVLFRKPSTAFRYDLQN